MKLTPFVTTAWLAQNLDQPDLRIVDATIFMDFEAEDPAQMLTSGYDYYQEGHIPGAIFADMFALNKPDAAIPFTLGDRDAFVQKVTELGLGDGQAIVVYDNGPDVRSGLPASYWASRLVWQLAMAGFDNVAVLDGGYPKWLQENRPVTTEIKTFPPATFSGTSHPELYASYEDVQAAIADDDVILIDSLSPGQYQGQVNPFGEDRAGHIPTACNVFFGELSDPVSKALYDADTLKAKFAASGALDPGKKVITYCGFGIAATWLWLVLKSLGQENVAVYDNSLSEWTADAQNPLEK